MTREFYLINYTMERDGVFFPKHFARISRILNLLHLTNLWRKFPICFKNMPFPLLYNLWPDNYDHNDQGVSEICMEHQISRLNRKIGNSFCKYKICNFNIVFETYNFKIHIIPLFVFLSRNFEKIYRKKSLKICEKNVSENSPSSGKSFLLVKLMPTLSRL